MLHLHLLGTPEIRLDEHVVSLETAKARALLFYLAVTQQPHSRDHLVDLLWSEMGQAQARRNLTATVTTLRKQLAPFVSVEPDRIAFNLVMPHQLDVARFRHHVSDGHAQGDMEALQMAIALYRGDFLAGLAVKDAFAFEEWLFAEREQLREQMLQAMQRLVEHAIARDEYATGVELAQRLLALDPWREIAHRQLMILHAQNGRRDAALAQYETCQRILADEVGVEPEEATRALYERLLRGSATPIHNLPAQPNPFIGRRTALAQITAHLGDSKCRLLSLVGPGGIGKTRLAVEAVRQLTGPRAIQIENELADGLYFVPLASIAADESIALATGVERQPSANALITAMAEALGLTFHGTADLRGQLLDFLKPRSLLIVCDNFEHLLSGRGHEPYLELLAAILRHAPHVKLLVTSRERLNLPEEWVLEIDGLDYPAQAWTTLAAGHTRHAHNGQPSAQAALAYDAVALFVQRAQQSHAQYLLTDAETSDVVRLCNLLEGMPLGLELAASWLRDLPVAEIVNEIEAGLDLLTTRLHHLPARHQSLAAVFDYSWQRLTPADQHILCGLSLFRGSFSREAAAEIIGARLPTLARLADKSLLRRVPQGRYEIHEMLRQYLAEKLREPDHTVAGANAWRPRFSRYYLALLQDREVVLRRAQDGATRAELWQEVDNLRQAWQWAVAADDSEMVAAGLGGLTRFYDVTGLFEEAEDTFQQAVTHFLRVDWAADEARADHQAASRRELVVRLWIEQARHACRRGQSSIAMQILPQATMEAHRLRRVDLEALSHLQWAEAASMISEPATLQEHAQRALELARAAGRLEIEAEALRYCGIHAERLQQIEEAADYFDQALIYFRQVGDPRGASLALNNWALTAHYQHHYAAAQAAFEEALQGFTAIGDRWGQNIVLNNLGNLHFVTHAYEAARAVYQQGLTLARQLHDRWGESHLLHNLGALACFLALFEEAQENLAAGLQLRREIGARLHEGFSMVVLGVLHEFLGEYAMAIDYFEQTEAIAQEQSVPLLELSALTQKGHTLVRLEEIGDAHVAYTRAVALSKDSNEPDAALEAMAGLAEVKLLQGANDEAVGLVETLLLQLESETVQSEIDPFHIHLCCYRVLSALHDARAYEVVAIAQRQLHERAAQIHDLALRQKYLELIPSHRALLRLHV
jgi:DNA-binding SARP family transcriptional activator/predicted ATPase